ncbi:MAG: tetratricopeptide repeat protein [Geminicoccales bacterium]
MLALDPGPAREIALALAHDASGDSTAAVQLLSRAARRYPTYRYTYVVLGRVWLDLAQTRDDPVALNKAIEALQNATGAEDNGEALMLSGRALLLAGDVVAAERALQQATEKLPVETAAFSYLADAAERLGHLDVAREALLDYNALVPDAFDRRRAVRIADLSMRLEDPKTALVWYQRVAADTTPDAALLVRVAEAHWASGNPDGARTALQKALALEPRNTAGLALKRKLR